MNKKRIISVVFISLLLCFMVGCSKEEPVKEKESSITPLLYKVTKEGSSNCIYLFGSIHVADKSAYPLPSYVLDAYESSDYLAVEADIVSFASNYESQLAMINSLTYTDGTTVKDHLSLDLYNKVVDYLTEKSMYIKGYDAYHPYMFVSLISDSMTEEAGLTSDGIDEYLIKKAKKENKELLEIESVQEQTDLLLGFDYKLYELMLDDTLSNIDLAIDEVKMLYDAWKSGNYDDLVRYTSSEFDSNDKYTEEELSLIDDYTNKLIDDRNVTMTDELVEYFEDNKKVFFTVGAGHVVGDNGIANALENIGYKVELVK